MPQGPEDHEITIISSETGKTFFEMPRFWIETDPFFQVAKHKTRGYEISVATYKHMSSHDQLHLTYPANRI